MHSNPLASHDRLTLDTCRRDSALFHVDLKTAHVYRFLRLVIRLLPYPEGKFSLLNFRLEVRM